MHGAKNLACQGLLANFAGRNSPFRHIEKRGDVYWHVS